MIDVYNYFRSSTSFRVRIALNLKGLDYKYLPVHLLNNGGEQNSEAYRKLNPVGGVPTINHNDFYLGQTMAILEYLDEAFPQSYQLFPKELKSKAKVRQVCETVNADIHPLTNLKVLQYLDKLHSYNQDQKDQWCQKWIQDGFTAIEKMIAPYADTFAFGSVITAADVFIAPQAFSALRFKVELEKFPLIQKIYHNCLKIDAFDKAHPLKQIDTPADLKI